MKGKTRRKCVAETSGTTAEIIGETIAVKETNTAETIAEADLKKILSSARFK